MSATDKHILLKELEGELASAREARQSAVLRVAALEQAVNGVRDLVKLNGGSVPTTQQQALFEKDAFADMGTVEAAVKFLGLVGKPQTNRQVVDALIQGGKKSDAKSIPDTIRTTLLREAEKPAGRLRWVNLKWELTEWAEK